MGRRFFHGISTFVLISFCCFPVWSATFTVTTETDDDGPCMVDDCALREAVLAANALPGKDTILIPAGTYHLTLIGRPGEGASRTGSLDLRDDADLVGAEAPTVIVGDGEDGVLTILGSDVTLSRLVITGGVCRTFCNGGGIFISNSRATITDSIIKDNMVLSESGGGMVVLDSEVQLINSSVTGNSANHDGGGILRIGTFPRRNSDLTLINTTVSGNSADQAGGIFSTGFSDLILVNSSIVGNSARVANAILMDGQPGPIWSNTLVEGDCFFFLGAATTSLGGNIESPGSTCFLTDPTDRMGVPDLGIGPLTTTASSPTPYHPLLAGSPAIDTAVDAECPATDQRGRGRPIDGDLDGTARCDVGAIEAVPAELVAEIPALGRWGWLVLVVGLGAAGWWRVRAGG